MFSRFNKVILFILITGNLNAVTLSEIARLEVLPLHRVLSIGRSNIRQNIDLEVGSSFAPRFTVGNTLNYLGSGFNETEFTDLRNRLTNRVGVAVTINLPEIIKSYNGQNEQVLSFNSSVTEIYINISRRIYQSNSVIENIRFLKELRSAIFDFEKQITLDERVLARQNELLGLYQELVVLQLQLYRSAGVVVGYDIENISFNIERVTDFLKSAYLRLEAKN